MLSMLSVLAALGLLVLISLFLNVGRVVARKLEIQNAADAVATAATVELARALNAITTANHLIGELTALDILHHGFGGDELDEGRSPRPTPTEVRQGVEFSYEAAVLASSLGRMPRPLQAAYGQVSKEVQVGGAVREARIRLKRVLTWAFTAHAVGGLVVAIVEKLPWVGPALGPAATVAMVVPALVFEGKVLQEWYVLDGLEWLAKTSAPVKKTIHSALIPGLYLYSRSQVVLGPVQMERAAEQVGERNKVEGRLYPGLRNFSWPPLQLPVAREPERPKNWPRSQLVRSTTPWVQYWRVPWLRFGEDVLLLSRFKCYYWDRTDDDTRTITERLRDDSGSIGVRLLALEGWSPDGVEKGAEEWTRAAGSREADRLFGVVGFAHRGPRPVVAPQFFPPTSPYGTAGYAQGMAYNANPQRRAGPPGYQPVVGWDTLNWAGPVREYPGPRPEDPSYPVPEAEEPRIRVNWQAKLVPTTRLDASIFWQQGDLGHEIRRSPPLHLNLTGTH